MVPLLAGQSDGLGTPVLVVGEPPVPVDEGTRLEFPLGTMLEDTKLVVTEPEGVILEPPRGPVGIVGKPGEPEVVVVALPEAEGMVTEPEEVRVEPPRGPVGIVGEPGEAEDVVLALREAEGMPPEDEPYTMVVVPGRVVVEKMDGVELEETVLPVPTGAELLALETLDGGGCTEDAEGAPEELTVADDDGSRLEAPLPLGNGTVVELFGTVTGGAVDEVELPVEDSDCGPRLPEGKVGLPMGPVDVDDGPVPVGVFTELGNPLETDVDGSRLEVALPLGTGRVVELFGTVIGGAIDEVELPVDDSDCGPRLPEGNVGLPIGPVDEEDELAPGDVVAEVGAPLETDVKVTVTEVLLLDGTGADEEPTGPVEAPDVAEVELPEGAEIDEDEAEPGPPEDDGDDVGDDEDEREFGLSGPVVNVGKGILPEEEILPVENIVVLGLDGKVVGLTV